MNEQENETPEAVTLPEGVTTEMIEQFKIKHKGVVKLARLFDPESSTDYGSAIVGKPGVFAINQFEKLLEKDPLKAKLALINGTFCTRVEEIKNCDQASKFFSACFDAAAQMLPVGKAELKNL